MKTLGWHKHSLARGLGIALMQIWLGAAAYASSFQLISAPDPEFKPPADGAGDSYFPVVSRDGRYVLFGSTADNLVPSGTNRAIPPVLPIPINVFLRDRSNGSNVLVSVNLDGSGGGNGDSLPMGISTNGRYALFESKASNLVPGDTNNATDLFMRDLQAGTTVLVSVGTNGTVGDGGSYSSVMTPDGRYVAFASTADNLVPGDTNGMADVFVRDMVSNVTSVVSAGAQPVGSYSYGSYFYYPYLLYRGSDTPIITPDGRYIAFFSTGTNLAPGVGTIANVYVRDQIMHTSTWASVGALPALQSLASVTNSLAFNHAVSDDGRFIVFEAVSYAQRSLGLILRYDTHSGITDVIETNAAVPVTTSYEAVQNLSLSPDGRFVAYVANALDTSGTTTAIRVWDAQTGVSTLVSGNTNNSVTAGSLSDSPILDENGRFVAFVSGGPDLVPNASPADFHVYLRDLQTQTTTLVDADTNSAGSLIDPSITPAISEDAHLIAFDRQEGTPGPLNRKHAYDVLARDVASTTIELVSAHDPSSPSLTPEGSSVISSSSVSSNGRFIGFWSEADDLIPNDTNGLRDVFVRDALIGTSVLVSVNTNGVSADGFSTDSAISADARYVAFTSFADDLVTGDTNRALDVFVRDLQAGTTTLVSVNGFSTGPGNGSSYSPLLSSSGQVVVFHSQANNLVPGMSLQSYVDNLFWRDLRGNRTYALTTNQFDNKVTAVSMTPDGSVVALATSGSFFNASQLTVWDPNLASIVYSLAGGTDSFGPLAISPDGQKLVYVTNGVSTAQLVALDLISNTNWVIASYQGSTTSSPRFSADSRFVAYVASLGPSDYTNQVYVYDFQTGTNLLVSHSYDGVSAGDNDSDSPDISFDGRFVSYRSTAGNLVPGVTNMLSNIFLYDKSSGATTLITASRFGGSVADNRSLAPVFSGDGRTLVFESWAVDLIPNDFNHSIDVFALGLYSNTPPFAVSVSSAAGAANCLSWPVMPGKSYRVQFKQNLEDATWQDLSAQVSIIGNQAYLTNGAAVGGQRFYRIVAY